MDDEKKIIEKRSSFRGWKERNKGKSNPKIKIIGVAAMVVIFSTLIIYYSYVDKDMDKNNNIIPIINRNSSNGGNNSSLNIVITPEIPQVATPKIPPVATPKIIKNIIGKMGTPLVINGFEINVTKVSSSFLYTNVWITVKNIDNKEKPFSIGPSTVILDNIGFQYEKVQVKRSSEIVQTNLAAKAQREGSIFFEPLKEGRSAKKLILDMKEEKAEIMLEE